MAQPISLVLMMLGSLLTCVSFLSTVWNICPGHEKHEESSDSIDMPPAMPFSSISTLAPTCELLTEEDVDFTLVTQLSVNRLHLMKEQCRRWGDHPISVAVASPFSKPTVRRALNKMGCVNLILSVILVDPDDPYPINKLRNTAFANIRTSHGVYVDADFLVSPNLYESLVQQRSKLSHERDALVIPALTLRSMCSECEDIHVDITPETKAEAFEMYSTEEYASVKQFDFKNPGGHNSTRTEEWFMQEPHTVKAIDCISSERYEPYVAVRYCRDMPPFQEAFSGYGQNKVTWTRHLIRAGYRFHRLADAFLVHFPHARSKDWKRRSRLMKSMGKEALEDQAISRSFTRWLETSLSDKRVMPMCEGVQ